MAPASVRVAERFPCFDGVRAIAALSVIVFHSVFFTTGFQDFGGEFLANLDVGVWIFFVVSGFLLYRPFAAAHLVGAPPPSVGAYLRRRGARIYPAYWLALVFFTLVVHETEIKGARNIVLDVTLTYTYAGRTLAQLYQGLPIAWSLVVEVSFYIFLPVYAAVVGSLARRWRPLTAELTSLVALGGVGIVCLVLLGTHRAPVWMTVLPVYLHVFALGMLLAVIVSHHWGDVGSARCARAGAVPWLWWILALAVFLVLPRVGGLEISSRSAFERVAGDLGRALIGVFVVAPAVLGATAGGRIRSLLRSRAMTFLGVVSYGLYLWHYFTLLHIQREWLGYRTGTGNWLALFVVALPVVVAAATASWFLLERPIIALASSGRGKPSPARR